VLPHDSNVHANVASNVIDKSKAAIEKAKGIKSSDFCEIIL